MDQKRGASISKININAFIERVEYMKPVFLIVSILIIATTATLFLFIDPGFTQPPSLPIPPSRTVPWGLEEIIGALIALYGLYRIQKSMK
jgi:hypothetical protein